MAGPNPDITRVDLEVRYSAQSPTRTARVSLEVFRTVAGTARVFTVRKDTLIAITITRADT